MDQDKKLRFLENMTHMALSHAASTPNMATPTGGMSHDKMLEFVHKVAEKGIKHFDMGGTTSGGLVGGVGNALGTTNNFQAQAAPIQAGTNASQINNAYTGAQNALGQQQNLANLTQTGASQGTLNQQQLGNMYLQQAQGQGPNPSQAELNQNTGANIAQQAALAAGQRGAGANAGLIAAQNAQQGAATQQQAVGQAATLGAQQQLAAESNLQNLAATQIGQTQGAVQGLNNAQQNEQNILQGANTATNNALVSQQSNINNVNAGISQGNQNTSANILSGIGSGLSSAAGFVGSLFADGGMVKMDKGGNVLDANARKHIAPHNFALPGGRYPIHDISHARNALARVSQNGTPEEKAKVRAAVHKKYPSLSGSKKMAEGGEVGNESKGQKSIAPKPMVKGPVMMAGGGVTGQATSAPSSFIGNWLNSASNASAPISAPGYQSYTGGASPFSGISAPNFNKSPAPSSLSDEDVNNITAQAPSLSTGASDLTALPSGQMAASKGGLMKKGGKVIAHDKAEKAVKKGDSLENDKVPAMLSEGEMVIPRHIMMHPNAPAMAAKFVADHLKNKGMRK